MTNQPALPPNRALTIGQRTLTGAELARALTLFAALMLGIGAVAYYRHWSLVTEFWKMPDQAMSYRFMGSYVAAFAGSLLWVAITGQLAALAGIALTVIAGGGALAAYYARLAWQDDDRGFLLVTVVMVGFVVTALVVFRWSRSLPETAPPQPRFARIAFTIFIILLVLAATRCLRLEQHIFPWDLAPRWSTQIGLLLGASAVYFLYGLMRGTWTRAGGQLAGFIIYDLVLAIPYAQMVRDRAGSQDTSSFDPIYGFSGSTSTINGQALAVVIAVISTSALIAIWYLAIDRRTRLVNPASTH